MKTLIIAVTMLCASLAVGYAEDKAHDYNTKRALTYKSVTPAQMATLPDDTPIAVMCEKCKTVTTLTKRDLGTKPGKGSVVEASPTHACPDCGGKMTLKPGSKETEWVHSCKKCGDHAVSFCAPTGKH